MRYKGKRIQTPTLSMIREQVKRRHFDADPEWIYNYYKARDWKNTKGKVFATLEIMVGTGNSYFANGKKPKYPSIYYDQQLKDERWFAFREFIFAVREKRCEQCGAADNLQIHHPKYIAGRLAWEYTCNEVQVLCRKCHAAIHGKPVDS